MTEEEVLEAYAELRSLVNNIIGFDDLAEHAQKNDSLRQLISHAYVYASGHVLARRVFSLSQRIDEWGGYCELADALRPLRQLCAEIVGANAWVDDEAAPEDERVMNHAQAYAKGYELAVRLIRIHRNLTSEQ